MSTIRTDKGWWISKWCTLLPFPHPFLILVPRVFFYCIRSRCSTSWGWMHSLIRGLRKVCISSLCRSGISGHEPQKDTNTSFSHLRFPPLEFGETNRYIGSRSWWMMGRSTEMVFVLSERGGRQCSAWSGADVMEEAVSDVGIWTEELPDLLEIRFIVYFQLECMKADIIGSSQQLQLCRSVWALE